jgi:hypothetical protein
MPLRIGTLVLLVINLCFAPVALAGIFWGQGYLRAACLGLVLPGLAMWWVGTNFHQSIAQAVDFSSPGPSAWWPYYQMPGYAPAPTLAPPSVTYPSTSAPPGEAEPTASEPATNKPTTGGIATPDDPGYSPLGPPVPDPAGTPVGPIPFPVQPIPPQVAYAQWLDPSFLMLRQLLIANPILAALCVACAVGTKWFHDLQPATV